MLLYGVLGAVSIGSVLAALASGSFPIRFSGIVDSVVFPAPGLVHDIVWNLRAPRALAAFACGALLALAGTLLQVLLRNALADPYILGVSGGAAVGAVGAIVLGLGSAYAWSVPVAAFAGALLAIFLVLRIAASVGRALEAAEQAERQASQVSLFGEGEAPRGGAHVYVDAPPWDMKQKLLEEKAALGFYLSGHPLEERAGLIGVLSSTHTAGATAAIGGTGSWTWAWSSRVGSSSSNGTRPANLVDRLLNNGTADTRSVAKGVCAAVLGSAVTLVQ